MKARYKNTFQSPSKASKPPLTFLRTALSPMSARKSPEKNLALEESLENLTLYEKINKPHPLEKIQLSEIPKIVHKK